MGGCMPTGILVMSGPDWACPRSSFLKCALLGILQSSASETVLAMLIRSEQSTILVCTRRLQVEADWA